MQKKFYIALALVIVFVTQPLVSVANYAVGRDEAHTTHAKDTDVVATEVIVKMKDSDDVTRVAIKEGETVESVVARYEGNENVEFVEPNFVARALGTPNDILLRYQWNFASASEGGVDAQSAWNVTDGSGIVIAVLDTGVAYENYKNFKQAPDFSGTKFVQGYDFVNNDSHPNDDNGHGTHIAGTIAQTSNNFFGTAGLAHGATIMPVKVLDENAYGTYADIADGIRYATDNGADVINLSLGGATPSNTLESAVKYAYDRNVTVIAATGNEGFSRIYYPAAYNNYTIAVGASRVDGNRAPYSNYGYGIDVVAPGGDMDVDQNNDGYGDGILQQTYSGGIGQFSNLYYEGTSMATAHVSASVALIMSAKKASKPNDVRALLENNTVDVGTRGYDLYTGHGLINLKNIFEGKKTPTQTNTTNQTNTPVTNQQTQTNTSVVVPPSAPEFTTSPVTSAKVGETYVYQANAEDANGDYLRFRLKKAPSGMWVDSVTGRVQWKPLAYQQGSHTVMLEVRDTNGGYDRQEFTITVSGGKVAAAPKTTTQQSSNKTATKPTQTTNTTSANSAPQFVTTAPQATVTVGDTFVYQAKADDANGDYFSYRLKNKPSGMWVDSVTGSVQWKPLAFQKGTHTVTLEARDTKRAYSIQTFTITVR